MGFVTCRRIGEALIKWIKENGSDSIRAVLPQTRIQRGAATPILLNTYTANHFGTWPNEVIRAAFVDTSNPEVSIINIWDQADQVWRQIGVAGGEHFFNNPTFYVTDGAEAPDTSTFTIGGNTIATSFGSVAALMAFISQAYIFGIITINIQGRVHGMTLTPATVKGASSVAVRPRGNNAANMILEWGKDPEVNSRGIFVGGGLSASIYYGFTTECFGVGNAIGGFNSPIQVSGNSSLTVTLYPQVDTSFIRHTGDLPVSPSGEGSTIWHTDTGGNIVINSANADLTDFTRTGREYWAFNTAVSDNQFITAINRIGDNCAIQQNGVSRHLESDVHISYDVAAVDTGSASYRFGGRITANNPHAFVYGPGNIYVHTNAAINIATGAMIYYRASAPEFGLSTSVENYKQVMRYRRFQGDDNTLYSSLDRLSLLNFSVSADMPSTGTFGAFYGTQGTDLPAGT